MKKSIILFTTILLFIMTANNGFAQEEKTTPTDVVYLHNGSKILGKIIHINYEKYLEIETETGSKMRISFKDVKTIQYGEEEIGRKIKNYKSKKEKHIPEKKPYYAIGIHVSPGINGNRSFDLGRGLSISAGYRFNKNLTLGGGVGLDTYDFFLQTISIPVFAEYRYDFLNKSFTPFINIRGGYGFPHPVNSFNWGQTNAKGGGYLHPQAGVRLASRSKLHFNLMVGYTMQWYEQSGTLFVQNPNGNFEEQTYTDKLFFQRFTIGGALIF